jgi:hypothetical protein
MERMIEKLCIAVAWAMPRKLAYWAFIRVATEGSNEYPAEQPVNECMKRWVAARP